MTVLSIPSFHRISLHDPSMGFHDIKPLPEFSPIPLSAIIAATAIILLIFLLYRLYKRQSREVVSTKSSIAPHSASIEKLRLLDTKRREDAIGLRDLASEVSICFRTYLEHAGKFPASDLTVKEVKQALSISPVFMNLSELSNEIVQNLKFLETVAFSSNSLGEYSNDSPAVADSITQAIDAIQRINREISKSEESAENAA